MKIIDFARKGNLVRFYLGEDDLENWWGDDWNDCPYECNAGIVYPRFVSTVVDIAFPFDSDVLEPCDGAYDLGHSGSGYTKEDMKTRRVPCIIIVPKEEAGWGAWNYQQHVTNNKVQKFYFGDQIDPSVNNYIKGD